MHRIEGIGIAMLLMLAISLAFPAQDSSVLLEKAIYTEETLGKLIDAINIYKQIIDASDTNRTIGALALYRLGVCYRKKGDETEAFHAFSSLAQLYPEQKDLIAKSRALHLKPAPWADGEILRLRQKLIGAKNAWGFAYFDVESNQKSGKSAWDFRYFMGGSRNPIFYSVTVANAGTLMPITNRTLTNQTDLEASYAADKIEVLDLRDGAQSPKRFSSTGTVYDIWQIVPLLRCLPLQEGFQATIPVFEASTGAFANIKFAVVAREKIAVPAGSFDCYKVAMTSDDNSPTEQLFWISADSHAYLAKALYNGLNEFELETIKVIAKNQAIRIEDRESGISMSVPRHWYLTQAFPGSIFVLSAPELNSSLNMTTSAYHPQLNMAATWVDMRISASKMSNQPYQVRSQTQENIAIAGLSGVRYIADTCDNTSGEPVVEYAYLLSSNAKTYFFSFQTKKDSFDKMKTEFESIISSLKIQ
jgi:tetratricopeptide (TPR) repeat protein